MTAVEGAFAFAFAALSSRFAFALAASLACDDEEPLSFADFWLCDLAAVADLPLSLTALATDVSVALEFAAAFFASSSELDWGGLSTTAVVGADAGGEVTGAGAGAAGGCAVG